MITIEEINNIDMNDLKYLGSHLGYNNLLQNITITNYCYRNFMYKNYRIEIYYVNNCIDSINFFDIIDRTGKSFRTFLSKKIIKHIYKKYQHSTEIDNFKDIKIFYNKIKKYPYKNNDILTFQEIENKIICYIRKIKIKKLLEI